MLHIPIKCIQGTKTSPNTFALKMYLRLSNSIKTQAQFRYIYIVIHTMFLSKHEHDTSKNFKQERLLISLRRIPHASVTRRVRSYDVRNIDNVILSQYSAYCL